jgi:hypothetical protein
LAYGLFEVCGSLLLALAWVGRGTQPQPPPSVGHARNSHQDEHLSYKTVADHPKAPFW